MAETGGNKYIPGRNGGKGIRSYAAIENDENENDYKYLVQIALVDGKSYILGTNKYKDIWYQFDIMSNNIFSNHLQYTKKGFKSLSENSERTIHCCFSKA